MAELMNELQLYRVLANLRLLLSKLYCTVSVSAVIVITIE